MIQKDKLLIDACRSGQLASVEQLIAAGANVDTQDDAGKTALMISAWWSHAKTVTALIAAGANVDAHDHDGNTALMLAAREGNTESILALTIAPEAARIAGHMLDATTRRK